MSLEDLITTVFCLIEERYQEAIKGVTLRPRGIVPDLLDEEVLTMLVVGEWKNVLQLGKIYGFLSIMNIPRN